MAILRVEKKIVEEIEVELPFYYVQYLDNSTIHGRVDEHGRMAVQEIYYDAETSWEVSRDRSSPDKWACYLKPGNVSNEQQFNEALHKAYEFLDGITKLCYGRGQLS